MSYLKPIFILTSLWLLLASCSVRHIPPMPKLDDPENLKIVRDCQRIYSITATECSHVYGRKQRNLCHKRANSMLEQCYETIR